MTLQRITIPSSVGQQLASLPVQARHNVETYLENLDVLLSTAPLGSISQRLERKEGGFVAQVEGATILFTLAPIARAVVIQRIEPRT